MALAECLLYEGRSLESARGPQSFRTIPSRQLLTGEPCAGEPHARFGGRGVRLNRTSLPLFPIGTGAFGWALNEDVTRTSTR